MASNLYNNGILRLLNGGTSFINDTVKVLVVDNTYTFDRTHDFVDDITGEVSGTGYSRLALTGKTATLNASTNTVSVDCADLTFPSVNTANAWAGVVVFEDTGVDASSPVLGFFSMPELTTDGSNVTLVVGGDGLFEFTNNIQ